MRMFEKRTGFSTLLPALFSTLFMVALSGGCATGPRGLRAGQGASGPWWMGQTAMNRNGKLDLTGKSWWGRAAALKTGERFVIDADGPAKGRMLVRRERFKNRGGKEVEAIVWVIDDDGDGSLAQGGDRDSDCYIADYGGDGVVDRMVDYIDDDGDDDPDEMDIRYFVDGELRYTWFGIDLDDDSAMWSLRGYEYGGPSFFESDPYGDGMIYMNKLDTERGIWSPVSECPFAFYDTDGDAYSEMVVRVSAVPLRYDKTVDPDYANDYNRFRAPWNETMRNKGIVNIRYSFDVDRMSGAAFPLHYEMGFNLVGASPYEFAGMYHYNALRRPPQSTCVTPWKDLPKIADGFAARETGFSWHEHSDDTIAIGYAEHEKEDTRWEGVFWIWERRFMENTGGPCQKWNVRREWSRRPTSERELYYSAVDRRIHLFGAEEGWVQVGHFAGQGELGEVRMFDTDGNGYFDRWEVYAADDPSRPVRVTTVRDEKARPLRWEYESVSRLYTEKILPAAIATNEKLLSAMADVCAFDTPEGLAEAMTAGSPNHRRYTQDVVRELHYQALRTHFNEMANRVLRKYKKVPYHLGDLHGLKNIETTKNSQTAWRMARALERLDSAYGQGDFESACEILGDMKEIEAVLR